MLANFAVNKRNRRWRLCKYSRQSAEDEFYRQTRQEQEKILNFNILFDFSLDFAFK
ncbi:MAG: hypothetical protein N838_17100 [Thiohalocapsa sp. PB-PSB1]|nr:MAG: hypothetical protein N838_17100 [Thiohalocapsa sp. PB-PSB1]